MSELKKILSQYTEFNRKHYFIGALIASAVAAVIICVGSMYPMVQPALLPFILVPVGYGIFSVVCAVKLYDPILGFIIAGFCFSAGLTVGNEIMSQVQLKWAPHTIMKSYKSVPEQPNLESLERDEIVKNYIKLYKLAVEIEKENEELKEKFGIRESSEPSHSSSD